MLFEKIKELCAERKISIARLEKEVGLGNATVRGWENCSPKISTLKKVADYFGVTIGDLVDDRKE